MMSVFTSLLNFDFFAVRKRITPDGIGGWEIEYFAIPSVRGRLRPATSREREVAQREERFITHVFYCLANIDLERGDVISKALININGFELHSNESLIELEGVREPSTADEHFEIDGFEIQIDIEDIEGFRILETGDFRLLETGDFRLLE